MIHPKFNNTVGTLIVSHEPFSFFGGFSFKTGSIADTRSDVYQEALKDKILAIGSIVAEKMYGLNLPIISISEDDYQLLKTGLFVRINNEIIEVM